MRHPQKGQTEFRSQAPRSSSTPKRASIVKKALPKIMIESPKYSDAAIAYVAAAANQLLED
ncbi:hypothetical protein JCM31598_38250 [Desulfonatronum parangueonense]